MGPISIMCWAIALVVGAGPARADEDLLDRGIELRRAGDDAAALEVFQEAYARSGTARALAQVALAHQALGHWVEAEADLQQAIQMSGPWIARNQGALSGAMEKIRARLGTLEVRGRPRGAEVTVNGRSVGQLPLGGPLRVVAGDVAVQVSAEGHVTLTRLVPVGAGKRVRETFSLVAQSAETSVDEPSVEPRQSEGSAFFGAPGRESLVLEAGYASLPRITLLRPTGRWFAWGLQAGIDAALFGSTGESVPGTLTFHGGVPLVFEMVDDPNYVARLTVTPGVGLTVIDYGAALSLDGFFQPNFDGVGEYLAVLAHASLDIGRRVNGWFTVGGSVDVPTTFWFGGGTDLRGQPEEFSVVPVLLGPTLEFRLSEQARVGLAVRMGPHFTTGDLAQLAGGDDLQTEFGLAARLGFAFAL